MASVDPSSVLVVEDNWLLATEVVSWLSSANMNVIGPAATLDAAQALAVSEHFAFAVVDFNLRGEMADGLIADLGRRDVKVVVLTGYGDAIGLGGSVVKVLQKPCSRHDLIRSLSDAGAALTA